MAVTPIMDDPIAYPLAKALSDCFCAELAVTSAPVGCCCLYPGQEIAWDSCDPGMAWVRVAQVYPVGSRFPVQDTGLEVGPCGTTGGWAVVLELGALRCMPQPGNDGSLPPCGAVSDTARLVLADAHAMRRAVECCDWRSAAGGDPAAELVFGAWQPLGPQGACTGGMMQITVQTFGCICDPAPPGGTP